MQFKDWAVEARTVYGPKRTILPWTTQSVNCHIALKTMFFFDKCVTLHLKEIAPSTWVCEYRRNMSRDQTLVFVSTCIQDNNAKNMTIT